MASQQSTGGSETRRELRSLLTETRNRKDEFAQPENKEFLNKLRAQDHLFISAPEDARTAQVDGELFTLNADIAKERISRINIGDKETNESFNNRIISKFRRNGVIDWERLCAEFVSPNIPWTPAPSFLYGAMDVEVVARTRRARAPQEVINEADVTRPAELEERGNEKNPIRPYMNEIRKVLKERKKVDLYQLVVNPASFSQTVENCFHLAFVVKYGFAALSVDKDGCPVVEDAEPPEDSREVKKETFQWVLSLTHADFEAIVDAYGMHGKKPMLRHRERIPLPDLESSQAVGNSQKKRKPAASDDDDEQDLAPPKRKVKRR